MANGGARWAGPGAAGGVARAGVLAVLALGVIGCSDGAPRDASAAAPGPSPVYVDSIFPIEEGIRRFKAELPDSAGALSGGAASAEALVGQFMAALEGRDVEALAQLAISPAEFIHLYYPHTRFTAKPYEMGPDLLWFQLGNYGSKGMNRALDRFGGRSLGYVDHACDEDTIEGPNRLRSGCVVRVRDEDGATQTLSLFGQMIERDGMWKFINYANSL